MRLPPRLVQSAQRQGLAPLQSKWKSWRQGRKSKLNPGPLFRKKAQVGKQLVELGAHGREIAYSLGKSSTLREEKDLNLLLYS